MKGGYDCIGGKQEILLVPIFAVLQWRLHLYAKIAVHQEVKFRVFESAY